MVDTQRLLDDLQSVKVIVGDSALKNEAQMRKLKLNLHQLLTAIKTGKLGDIDLRTIDKANRPIVSQSNVWSRPKQQNAHYLTWSGLQVIDVDIKHRETASAIKSKLHQMLCSFPWYLATALSTSGNGLHIYTVTKPVIANENLTLDVQSQNARTYYHDAFEAKALVVWKCLVMCSEQFELLQQHEIALQCHPANNTASRRIDANGQKTLANVLDTSTCKISQIVYLTNDDNVLVNEENFCLLAYQTPAQSIWSQQDMQRFALEQLKTQFDRLRGRLKYNATDVNADVQMIERGDVVMTQEGTMNTVTPQNYDNTWRYRMAYTLAWLYNITSTSTGIFQHVQALFLQMCSGNPKFDREHGAWAKSFESAVERNRQGTAPCVWSAIKELRDKHGYKFKIKNRAEYTVQEMVAEHNTESLIKTYIMSKMPMNEEFEMHVTNELTLQHGEYLSTYKNELEQIFVHGLNFLIARPGSGKTEFIKQLTRDGKRVILVEPFTSILSSKIEHSDLDFWCVYNERQLELSKHLNIACTFDKFTNIDVEEASILFDYIVVDESHLLTMSAYRGIVPGGVIDKLQQLHTKVICMTGTPVSEHMFLNFQTITHVKKSLDFNKSIQFVCCTNPEQKIANIAKHMADTIKHGGKVLFPTNAGNLYVHTLSAVTEMLLQQSDPERRLHTRYYKRDNSLYDFVKDVNEKGTIGDLDILFCTNYLSVGIDINDNCVFDVIYDESITAQEIEQFNSRLRKVAINSYVYFAMRNSADEVKNITAYTPLDLTLTKLDQATFWDMLQMQIKRESIMHLFDYFAWMFNAPWFYKDEFTGETKVNLTVYKLCMFEQKWREWCSQLVVVQNILTDYGYQVGVTDNAVLDDMIVRKVRELACAARAEYKLEKNSRLLKMLKSFKNQQTFDEIIACSRHVAGHSMREEPDSGKWELQKKKRSNEVIYVVEDKRLCQDWIGMIRKLSYFYTYGTIMKLFDRWVADSHGFFRKQKLISLIDAINIYDAGEQTNMVTSNICILNYIINDIFAGSTEPIKIHKDKIEAIVNNMVTKYVKETQHEPVSPHTIEVLDANMRKFWKAVTMSEKDVFALRTLPKFDASSAVNRNSLKQISSLLFKTDIFEDTSERMLNAQKLKASVTELLFEVDEDGNQVIKRDESIDRDIISFKHREVAQEPVSYVECDDDFEIEDDAPIAQGLDKNSQAYLDAQVSILGASQSSLNDAQTSELLSIADKLFDK